MRVAFDEHAVRRASTVVAGCNSASASRRDSAADSLAESSPAKHHRSYRYWRAPSRPPRQIATFLSILFICWDTALTSFAVAFLAPRITETPFADPAWAAALLIPSVVAVGDIAYWLVSGHDVGIEVEWRVDANLRRYSWQFPFIGWMDLIGLLPWWALPGAPRTLHLLRALRMVHMYDVYRTTTTNATLRNALSVTMACFISSFLMAIHVSACLLQLVATVPAELAAESVGERYLRSIFSTIALFLSQTEAAQMRLASPSAHVVGSVLLLLGALLTALLFSTVSLAIQRATTTRRRFQEHLNFVVENMAFRKLDDDTRRRILQRYDYAWRKHRDGLRKHEDDFMDRLSPAFTSERLSHVACHLIDSLPPLDLPSDETYRLTSALVARMHPQFFLSGDVVVHKGDLGTQMYLLEEGSVAVQLADRQIELDQKFFGEKAVLAQSDALWNVVCTHVHAMAPATLVVDVARDSVRGATIVAVRLTDVLTLDLQELLVVHINFPSIVDSICRLAAERMIANARLLGQLESTPTGAAPNGATPNGAMPTHATPASGHALPQAPCGAPIPAKVLPEPRESVLERAKAHATQSQEGTHLHELAA